MDPGRSRHRPGFLASGPGVDYSEKQVASPGGHGAPGNGENVEVVTRLAESRIEHRLGEVQAPAGSLRDVWGR